MKYLLKFEVKKNNINKTSLVLRNKYREFSRIKPLIKFLFENAIYIDSYEIFDVCEFEKEENPGSLTITGRGCDNTLRFDSANCIGAMN